MTASILCPGPSLARLTESHLYVDLVVAVNRAATRWPCTVWACGDTPLFEQIQHQVIGSPTWMVSQSQLDVIHDHIKAGICQPWRGKIQTIQPMLQFLPHAINWVSFTFTHALTYSAWVGCDEINVYGCDWEPNAPDFDGIQGGKNRSFDRFRAEKGIFQAICELLPKVKVSRIAL